MFNINYITTILKKVHSLEPQISVFLGGPEFLGNNQEFLLNNKYVNGVFKGEGEEVFNNFISSLIEGNSNWKCLQGFEYIESNNYISKDVVTTKDFCALKSPETSIFFNWDKHFVQLETSRGWFNKCKFCVSGIDCSPVQNLPLELLRERVLLIKQKGIKEIRVLDRTFNGNTQRAIDLLNLFKEFYPGMSFHLEIHPALLSTKFRRFLEQELPTGMLHVEAGMQSLNENVILECSRNGAPNKSLEGLEYLINLKKFEVHADLIAGLPLYTYKDLLSDVITLMEVKPGEIQLELLKLLPGTYFRDNADLYNIKYSPLPPYEVLETNNISYYELNKAVVLSKILDRWYNNSIWRDILVLYINNSLEKLADLVESLSKTDFAYKSYSQEYLSLLLFNFIKNEIGRAHV